MNSIQNFNGSENAVIKEKPSGGKRRVRAVDFVAFVLCFLIAFGIWIYVIGIESEEYEYTFTDVSVNIDGVSQLLHEHGLSVIGESEMKVNVTVKGYRSEILKYSAEDLFAYVDVNVVSEAGMHSLNVVTDLPEGKMSIVSTSPSAVNVFVDETDTKSVPIKVDLRYNIAETLTMHAPVPEIDTVEIVGPKTRIENVAYARVEYDLGTVTTSTTFKAPIKLYDDVGNEIINPYIKTSVSEVLVKLKVTGEKAVTLVPSYTVSDPESYDYAVTVLPQTLTLVGDPAALNAVDKLTVYIGNITNKTSDKVNAATAVTVPTGLTLAESDREKTIAYSVVKTPKTDGSEG